MNKAKVIALVGPPPRGKDGYRAAKRLEPIGKAGVEALRKIVAEKSYAKVNEVCVDLFSASAMLAVYNALNDANKARFEAMPVARAADVSFKLINMKGGSNA